MQIDRWFGVGYARGYLEPKIIPSYSSIKKIIVILKTNVLQAKQTRACLNKINSRTQ